MDQRGAEFATEPRVRLWSERTNTRGFRERAATHGACVCVWESVCVRGWVVSARVGVCVREGVGGEGVICLRVCFTCVFV